MSSDHLENMLFESPAHSENMLFESLAHSEKKEPFIVEKEALKID